MATTAQPTAGGITDVPGAANSVEIENLARLAVDDHNKKQGSSIEISEYWVSWVTNLNFELMDSEASGDVSKLGEVPKPKENVSSGSEDKVMKASGGDGSYISRKEFAKNPQGYFVGLHGKQKGNK
ncbi:Cystatin protein [Spatholobus suberectus]|nr:Cystatin protein [Spatholobus suberectus]